jgi:hypothetical protein
MHADNDGLPQDPYIKLVLHDGALDKGRPHVGESVKTTCKQNAGGNAEYYVLSARQLFL